MNDRSTTFLDLRPRGVNDNLRTMCLEQRHGLAGNSGHVTLATR